MKKYAVLVIVMFAISSFSGLAFSQSADRNPSQEAREGSNRGSSSAASSSQRNFRGNLLDVESIKKAVGAIEAQLAAIKKSVEGMETPGASGGAGNTQEMREQMRQKSEAVQKAAAMIDEQVLVLKGRQARTEFEESIAELQSIAASAATEKATKTEQLLQSLMDSRRKAFQEKAERLQIPVSARRGSRGGQGRGPGLEAQEASGRGRP